MGRRYDEVVDVCTHDGRLHSFIWGGRIYSVATVIGTWYVRHAWWRSPEPVDLVDLQLESRLWRVEARAGQGADLGVFDLVEGASWRLVQAWD